ncbi:pyrimidine-nucleoside phosphorylase [Salisediminibacterium halotolerans]|uniref:Pyrimidine-nucleoside phosphorylase n=2 Tax=Salisediminibacterium halotolerans TaxID=517425 RepID=A0A1H9P956_9BACI|nr:pyrimidine-nucleoside phosphorylase [Salisediminibacterium haloalkalitolerans]
MMRMVDLIEKKRDGKPHTKEEIRFIISGYTSGEIPEYQISAWAMAVYFQDMNPDERAWLTEEIVQSGDTIDLSAIEGIKVDKHSTGGVGDTTTLVLAPLVASIGVPVAKMSGRGLGHTGGTIDKLESLKGFSVEISNDEFIRLVNENKAAVIGQTADLTPADKQLYGLRDVTATVNSIPLIASSIMSKKLASGADAIVLDVKTGAGAFMKKLEESQELARAMVEIGKNLGRNTSAVISDMNQPLGNMIGNALEVQEAIDTLKGNGPDDLTELCLTLGSHMAVLAGKAADFEDARRQLEEAIKTGKALEQFKIFVSAQGGDEKVVDEPGKLPQAAEHVTVAAPRDGYVSEIEADEIGTAAMLLGAGRATKTSEIDLAVGIEMHKKIGDQVKKDEPLVTLYTNGQGVEDARAKVLESYTISAEKTEKPTLIYDVIT